VLPTSTYSPMAVCGISWRRGKHARSGSLPSHGTCRASPIEVADLSFGEKLLHSRTRWRL